ncbi:MAG: hypothetical protein ACRCSN_21660 [Dermatophilaceae bacterium]
MSGPRQTHLETGAPETRVAPIALGSDATACGEGHVVRQAEAATAAAAATAAEQPKGASGTVEVAVLLRSPGAAPVPSTAFPTDGDRAVRVPGPEALRP